MSDNATAPNTRGASTMKVLCLQNNIVAYGLVRVLNDIFGEVDVTIAGSRAEMVTRIGGAEFDLVLLDVDAPGMGGMEGVRRAVAMLPQTPFVVTGRSETRADILAAVRAGARGYIPNSARLGVLRHALPLILAGEFYLPAAAFVGENPVPALEPVPAGDAAVLQPLTRRQTEVLALLVAGHSNKQIARDLSLLDGTVKLHVKAILRKLGVTNRTQAALLAARTGLIHAGIGRG